MPSRPNLNQFSFRLLHRRSAALAATVPAASTPPAMRGPRRGPRMPSPTGAAATLTSPPGATATRNSPPTPSVHYTRVRYTSPDSVVILGDDETQTAV